MKLLFLTPHLSLIGGVANHYAGLHDYWNVQFKYCIQGHRHNIHAAFWLIPDYCIFIWKLIYFKPDIVVINPSFRRYMLFRDGFYLLISKLFGRKVVCFMHGWDITLANKVEQHPILFNYVFEKADLTYVLCSDYAKQLQRMKFKGYVKYNTTKVDDKLLNEFNISSRKRQIINILYLARVSKSKGIYVALDAFNLLKSKYPYLCFTIVGNGDELENAKKYSNKHQIKDVIFLGGLIGKQLVEQFVKSDIYILPTYFEGMATSVLEAMAFGLPVITSPVGGVKDFFENGKMGFLIDSYNFKDYADAFEKLICNDDLYYSIALNNHKYAIKHFLASNIAKRMEHEFLKICE